MPSQSLRRLALLGAVLLLAGCGGSGGRDTAQEATPGYAVADEPQAAQVAGQILSTGGNAADAAAAAGLAMSVTLPSRAGLGGGGACIVRMAVSGGTLPPIALLFPPGVPQGNDGSRPAAVPTLARGLLALQARYGLLPYSSVVLPAERLAVRAPVSQALADDLAVVGPALLADPAAAAVFAGPAGGVLKPGDALQQPDLAATLERLRAQGVPGFYRGSFPQAFAAAANAAGAGLDPVDLITSVPVYADPTLASYAGYRLAGLPGAPAGKGPLPASAAFAALDRNGSIVACAVTMDNLFGTGRIAPGTGILLAASPKTVPAPLLRAAIAYKPDSGAFRAAVTGTGQEAAPEAVAEAMAAALNNQLPVTVPEPGRANVISCPGGVPGGEATCTAMADPRGHGLAIGGR